MIGFLEFVAAWVVLFAFCYPIFYLMFEIADRHKDEIAAIEQQYGKQSEDKKAKDCETGHGNAN
ncbi:MAG: hypothetical protein LKG24_00460 [Lacticaseibacillus songhuajiangensis]|jgi:hypothetical protein|nr:hypothetical protein [Lacticaseibacillus songhuajiangensis]